MSAPQTLPASGSYGRFLLAAAVVAATFSAGTAVPGSVTQDYPWAHQAVTQGLMLAFTLAAIAASRRPWAEFGFRHPTPAKGRFKLWGLLLGMASTGLILTLGLKGMRGLAAYGLGGIILWIWMISSIVEELFCRAWFQTLMASGGKGDPPSERPRGPVLWSAALFGAMHLPLLFAGLEIGAVAIILVSVTALGYVCALARARTGSLRPAIAAHVMFNIGGFLAGVIYTIAYRIATGQVPKL